MELTTRTAKEFNRCYQTRNLSIKDKAKVDASSINTLERSKKSKVLKKMFNYVYDGKFPKNMFWRRYTYTIFQVICVFIIEVLIMLIIRG